MAYGYMKVVSDNDKGYTDWQYKSYVRHAFITDDKNKVIDISYTHLNNIKVEKEPPTYLIMKKFSIDEYMSIVMKKLKDNPEQINLTFDNGEIGNETQFKEQAVKEGYILL